MQKNTLARGNESAKSMNLHCHFESEPVFKSSHAFPPYCLPALWLSLGAFLRIKLEYAPCFLAYPMYPFISTVKYVMFQSTSSYLPAWSSLFLDSSLPIRNPGHRATGKWESAAKSSRASSVLFIWETALNRMTNIF